MKPGAKKGMGLVMSLSLWFWTILTGSRLKGMLLEGRRLLKNEHLTMALRLYREVAEKWPDRLEGYEGMERAYRDMGLLDEARREAVVAEALRMLRENPGDLDARLRLARQLVEKQMYATALPHMEHALKTAPSNQDVLRLATVVLRYNNQLTRALETVNQALAKEPLAADLYEQQAFTLRALNRLLEATQSAAAAQALQAVAREPTSQEAMERAIFQLTVVKRRKYALTLVERCLADYPQAPALHCLRAELLMEEGRQEEARANLLETVALDPTRLKAHVLLASLYLQLGEKERGNWHREVAELLDQSRRNPDRVDSEGTVIEALLRLKQVEQAEHKASDLCRKYPQDWRGHAALGRVRQAQGKLRQALESYRQATRLNERAPEPFMATAWRP